MGECGYCGGHDGEHQADCLVLRGGLRPGRSQDLARLPKTGLEDTIGPSGEKLWSINVASARSAIQDDTHFVESFHVRARTYDGAIILARELRLDDAEDIEAWEIA